jgi:hypothetical protein
LVGVAVNVTKVPAQIAPDGVDAILTLTGRFGLTISVMAFDVAGFPVAHVALEVSWQVTRSPLANAAFV